MLHYAEEIAGAAARWSELGRPRPDVALVAGSGLGIDLGRPIAGPEALAEWLPFPVRTVPGHGHAVELLAASNGRTVLYFRGRLHGYQGYEPGEVVFPVRWAAALGVRILMMTNSSGAVDAAWPAGTLAVLRDQLNLTARNPLWGEPPAAWGPRFPDMSEAYDPELRRLARAHAGRLGFELREAVYAGLPGPSYETPAEVRMLGRLGADLVGMSTVLEVIAARHLGLRCLVISLAANSGAGVSSAPLSHDEVLAAGREAAGRVRALLAALLDDPALDAGPQGPTSPAG